MGVETVILNGGSLTISQVAAVAYEGAPVALDREAVARVSRSRRSIDAAVERGDVIYGVNTGFGKLAEVRIADGDIIQLQKNLVRSHAAGVGDPLPLPIVRAVMLLRANVLLRTTSGARPVLSERLVDFINCGIHPVVPEQGSVGACGDLAPLSHVALCLMGEGEVLGDSGPIPTGEALKEKGLEPVEFLAKEGLSFINGTQAQTAILSLLVNRARILWQNSVIAAATSLEALKGTPTPFDHRIHESRPHPGQKRCAELLNELLADSEIRESHREDDPRVQDAYSMRCTPQVLGPVYEAIEFAASTVEIELNSSTDNPLVFGNDVLSGGNFHGQVVAQALDFLTIALTTMAGLSERRIERLVNPDLSQGLPAFLAQDPGLQSGFMMVQITAAALVAESRTLATPGSVQSIPTDANQEDFVPMGMASAFKARRVLANAEKVIASELIAASQGLEFLKPLLPGIGVRKAYERVRELVAPYGEDRPHTKDIEKLGSLVSLEIFS